MGLFKLSEKPVVTRSHRHNKIVMHHVLEKVLIRLLVGQKGLCVVKKTEN